MEGYPALATYAHRLRVTLNVPVREVPDLTRVIAVLADRLAGYCGGGEAAYEFVARRPRFRFRGLKIREAAYRAASDRFPHWQPDDLADFAEAVDREALGLSVWDVGDLIREASHYLANHPDRPPGGPGESIIPGDE